MKVSRTELQRSLLNKTHFSINNSEMYILHSYLCLPHPKVGSFLNLGLHQRYTVYQLASSYSIQGLWCPSRSRHLSRNPSSTGICTILRQSVLPVLYRGLWFTSVTDSPRLVFDSYPDAPLSPVSPPNVGLGLLGIYGPVPSSWCRMLVSL